jgi:hypothetical protein
VLKKKDINPFVITPILHYSNSPKLIEIESYHEGIQDGCNWFGYAMKRYGKMTMPCQGIPGGAGVGL